MKQAALPTDTGPVSKRYFRWRARIFITCWTMYATYYLCRVNLSVAVPALKSIDWIGESGVAWIMTSLYLSYGLGQLMNGILGDRFGARRVATIGMVISAVANVVFGLAMSFPAMLGAWIVNGLAQATGAPSRIKVFSNWFSPRVRGRMMGFLGTDYVVGNVAAWLLSGYLLTHAGWQYVFFVPAGILLLSALHFGLRVRNAPEDVGLPPLEEMERAAGALATVEDAEEDAEDDTPFGHILRDAILNPRVWIVGLAYFGVDLFRYGFLGWSFAYLLEIGAATDMAIIKIIMLPAIGAVGIVLSGWITDRMGGRRAPVIAVMLLLSAVLAFVFFKLPGDDVVLSMIVLGGIGFFLYGPHLLMGATIAMDLGSRKASGTASGIIDALGYMGAAVSGIGTKWAKDVTGDWSGPFTLWIAGVVVAAILMLFLWNVRPRTDSKYV